MAHNNQGCVKGFFLYCSRLLWGICVVCSKRRGISLLEYPCQKKAFFSLWGWCCECRYGDIQRCYNIDCLLIAAMPLVRLHTCSNKSFLLLSPHLSGTQSSCLSHHTLVTLVVVSEDLTRYYNFFGVGFILLFFMHPVHLNLKFIHICMQAPVLLNTSLNTSLWTMPWCWGTKVAVLPLDRTCYLGKN